MIKLKVLLPSIYLMQLVLLNVFKQRQQKKFYKYIQFRFLDVKVPPNCGLLAKKNLTLKIPYNRIKFNSQNTI